MSLGDSFKKGVIDLSKHDLWLEPDATNCGLQTNLHKILVSFHDTPEEENHAAECVWRVFTMEAQADDIDCSRMTNICSVNKKQIQFVTKCEMILRPCQK